MAGWIKMPHGMEVDLGPGNFVLDGDPAPLPQRGTAPTQFSAHICCSQNLHGSRCHLVYGARPQPQSQIPVAFGTPGHVTTKHLPDTPC